MKKFGIRKVLIPFELKVLFCQHKAYLDQGWGLLNYFKYFLYAWAGSNIINTGDYNDAFIMGALFFTCCYICGWIWYNTDMVRASAEIGNRWNLLTEELRKKFKLKSSKQ